MPFFSHTALLSACLILGLGLPLASRATPLESDGALCIDALYGNSGPVGAPPRLASWSPDGARLAFVWGTGQGSGATAIWTWSRADAEPRRIVTLDAGAGSASIDALAWLDGQHLAYISHGGLYAVDDQGRSTPIEAPIDDPRSIDVSGDGSHIAVIAADGLWLLEAGGAENGRRVYSTQSERVSIESVRWSGDGGALAFVIADDSPSPVLEIPYVRDGKERLHLVPRPFPGGETTHRRIGVWTVADEHLRWLDGGDPSDVIWAYAWAHDGQRLLVDSSNFLATQRRIAVYEVGDGAVAVHYENEERGRYNPYWSTLWAPDDEGLIILSDHEGFYHLYRQREPGGTLERLTSGNWEIAAFDVDATNGYVYFLANRDHVADRRIYRLSLEPGSSIEPIGSAPGTYVPSWSPTFLDVAYTFSDDLTPPDLYHVSLSEPEQPASRRITRSQSGTFETLEWARIEYIEFASHVDGAKVHGRLYLPPGMELGSATGEHPLIVGSVYSDTVRNHWGGRAVHPTWGLDQCLISSGYLVLSVNVRGSWGQGRAFREARREFGSIELDDIESGVRYLVAEGLVDADRVGIWGSSYGGLMTTMSLFRKPGVYAAGIAGAPATNVWHAFPGEMRVMGEPSGADYPARYERQSSLYFAEGLEDHLMIIHGTRDDVVLYGDSIALAERLIAAGKPFELVTLPGIGHQWDNEDSEMTRFVFKKMIEFFDRHLKEPSDNAT